MKKTRFRTGAAAVGLVLLFTVGCSGDGDGDGGGDAVRIEVDKVVALADESVRIEVTGLDAGQEVTVTSRATDHAGTSWSGRAAFAADEAGAVDLTRARPRSGTYEKADGMGLFWSMNAQKAPADEAWFYATWPEDRRAYEVHLAVEVDGKQVAAERLTRTWMSKGVVHRPLTAAKDGVVGTLYQPAPGAPRRPPVLSFGGSEGGPGDKHAAALLASRGHPVLALCYFGCPERPENLERIELEYFADAARLLHREAGAGAQRPSVIGNSRGSEAAQLLAHHHPDLVRDVVLYAPSRDTNPGIPDPKVPAWTKDGEPIELKPIPLDRVRGTVLAIGGGKDGLWPAGPSTTAIGEQRGASGQQHRALLYPDAGHGVGTYPHTAAGLRNKHHLTGQDVDMGGTRAAAQQARSDSWPQVLELLQD
ncbi:acyl-CoA thioesterase/bile acid-CoA:amino acid N-acyltransferase family protein [Streptomyces sp. NPDC048057]|uniref:acyl-CoA thioesterase/bile acid-CoA:amino acid N-acyltransferase family protein n=1 Tax=Streptomyces sp. NPDC048057 TaxID=3155628 RepID=UPI0033E06E67